ncbi:photosystem II repair protein PSB27-H1, chloroplastic [Trifolium repens]|jgi:photosystem II Psb27 protein|nr:photosystem II repair protein PSB27-H1, chloroplastic [Trifolium repens]
MASPTLITPTTTPKSLPPIKTKPTTISSTLTPTTTSTTVHSRRRQILSTTATIITTTFLAHVTPAAFAATDEEYIKETEEVINKVRTTITLDKNDPNVANAVSDLRDSSNSWVAKYRREKALLARASFRDMYSALNAVSGHYISFGPTAPIPAKRRVRILEEIEVAEKSLKRGR